MNYVYLLRCCDGSLYCGWTTDLQKRVACHNRGHGAKYTRSRLPVKQVYAETWDERNQAMSRENRIKRMSKDEKEKLVRNWESSSEKNDPKSAL